LGKNLVSPGNQIVQSDHSNLLVSISRALPLAVRNEQPARNFAFDSHVRGTDVGRARSGGKGCTRLAQRLRHNSRILS
jgi:hypothetical protein